MIDDRFEWISCREDTPKSLKAAYLSERDVTLRSRLHGLWLLRSGRRLSEYQLLGNSLQLTREMKPSSLSLGLAVLPMMLKVSFAIPVTCPSETLMALGGEEVGGVKGRHPLRQDLRLLQDRWRRPLPLVRRG